MTRNQFGQGEAYYVATRSDHAFYRKYIRNLCGELEIAPVMQTPDGVEATVRENEKGSFLFILNHREEPAEITIPAGGTDLIKNITYHAGESVTLASKDVIILKKIK